MISLLHYTILVVLCPLEGCNWRRGSVGCDSGRQVKQVLRRRGVGIPYEYPDRVATKLSTETTETGKGSRQELNAACFHSSQQNCDIDDWRKIESDHRNCESGNKKKQVSSGRKAEIANKLLKYQEQALAMRTEWKPISMLMGIFDHEKNVELLKTYAQEASKMTIDETLEDLRNYHKYILRLVQDRLCGWGGLGGLILGTKNAHQKIKDDSEAVDLNSSQELDLNLKSKKGKQEDTGATSNEFPSTQLRGYPALLEVRAQKMKKMRDSFTKESKKPHDHSREAAGPQQNSDLLPQTELRGDGPISLISQKLGASGVDKLNEILRSITISTDEEELLTSEENSSTSANQDRRFVKISFEMCVFKALEFMYKFGFINKNDVRSFFLADDTLTITALHITDLFHTGQAGFLMCQTFMPEFSFIRHHPKTKHLHLLLADLEGEEQAHIIFTTLKATVKAFNSFEDWLGIRSERIHDFLIGERAHVTFHIKPREYVNSLKGHIELDSKSKEDIEKMINFFQNPIIQQPYREGLLSGRFSFLIAFHILNFIRVYHPQILIKSFPENAQYEIFKLQIHLIKSGLVLHHRFNEVLYPGFIGDNDDDLCQSLIHSSHRAGDEWKKIMRQKLKESSNHYLRLWQVVSILSRVESFSALRNWSQGMTSSKAIIERFTNRAQLWEKAFTLQGQERYHYVNNWLYRAKIQNLGNFM